MPNLVDVVVAGERPFFNGALFYPGETTTIDLDDYQDRDEDGELTGKAPVPGKGKLKNLQLPGNARPVVPVKIAPVAPHAPNPSAAQGFPPGGKPSGSGETIFPDGNGGSFRAVPADGATSNETAAAAAEQNEAALEAAARFDHDGDGKPGGALKGGNAKK